MGVTCRLKGRVDRKDKSLKLKRKHTRNTEAIITRIENLEFERREAELEISELLLLLQQSQAYSERTLRDLEKQGIKPAVDHWEQVA